MDVTTFEQLRGSCAYKRGASTVILSLLSAAWPTGAIAQTPEQLLPPTREEVTRQERSIPQARAPRLEVEGGVERAPCALDSPDFANIRFTLRDVQFEGLQGMSPQELASAYAPYVGTEQPISVVCDVRDRAATILRDAGYIAAVQVPEQQIADGVVHLRVLMAHLTQVRVRGEASGAERIIAGYLTELTKQPVFNRYDAERYLLLASDLPGYNVRLTLRPAGTTPGDVIGDVTVQRIPAYVDANIQNAGSRALGRWGGLVRAQLFGLTGLGDRTTFSVFSTADLHEQQTVQIGHDFRVGSQGLSFSGNFTYAWARPDIPDAHVLARTLLSTVEADYPIIRRQAASLRGATGLDYVNQDVKLDGIDLTRDRLRVGFLRLGWDRIDTDFSREGTSLIEPVWRMSSSLELRKGLDLFGASSPCNPTGSPCFGNGDVPPSRTEGSATAGVVRGTFYGEFRPIRRVTVAVGGRAQYAWKPLLSFEEFSVGNYTVGRGYDPGTLLGDRGFGTQTELRFGSRTPSSQKSAAVEAYGFWDHAAVKNLDKVVLAGTRHVDSVGGGARVNFDRFALDASLAFPLTRVGPDDVKQPARLLISLSTRLWPWSYK